jgi:protein-S-isoprenylcysteine O-methyltransferase Ste14
VLLGLFGIEGVSVLTELTIVGLLGATYVVHRRGGGARWARWGAAGFGLLALAHICSIVATQWLLGSSLPVYQRVDGMRLFTIGQWLASTAGLAMLALAILSPRGSLASAPVVSDRGRATPGGVVPPPR